MLKYAVLKTFIQGVHEYKRGWVGDHLGCGFACSRHGRCLALLFLWEVRNRFFGNHVVQPLAHQIGVDVLQGRGEKNYFTCCNHVHNHFTTGQSEQSNFVPKNPERDSRANRHFTFKWLSLWVHRTLKGEDYWCWRCGFSDLILQRKVERNNNHHTLFRLFGPPFSFWYKSSLFWKREHVE